MSKVGGSECVIRVRVIPKSSQNQVVGKENGAYRVKVTSPPVDGRANKALIKILSKHLHVKKSSVTIISGERSRNKSVLIQGISKRDVETMLGQKR